MAISDITKMAAMYAQPTQFDQEAWKSAFDIANAFTNAENNRTTANDNARKYAFNMATQDSNINMTNAVNNDKINQAYWDTKSRDATTQNKIDYTNWKYGNDQAVGNLELQDAQRKYNNALLTDPSKNASDIAQNQYNATSYDIGRQGVLGQDETIRKIAPFMRNADGSWNTNEQAYNLAVKNGVTFDSAYALAPIRQQALTQAENLQALQQTLLNNAAEMTVDALGNRVPTGRIDQGLFDAEINKAVAIGAISKEQANAFKARLFPVAPNRAVLPTGLGIGTSGFSGMLDRLNGAPATPTVAVSPAVAVPYALNNVAGTPTPASTAQNAAAAQVAATAAPQVIAPTYDYRKYYGITEQDLPYIQQAQNTLGLSEEQATQLLRPALVSKRNGFTSPEQMAGLVQQVINQYKQNAQRAQWYQQNQAAIDDLMKNNFPAF